MNEIVQTNRWRQEDMKSWGRRERERERELILSKIKIVNNKPKKTEFETLIKKYSFVTNSQ